MIREDPAGAVVVRVRGRGTEASAEVLVGPPWRIESNACDLSYLLTYLLTTSPRVIGGVVIARVYASFLADLLSYTSWNLSGEAPWLPPGAASCTHPARSERVAGGGRVRADADYVVALGEHGRGRPRLRRLPVPLPRGAASYPLRWARRGWASPTASWRRARAALPLTAPRRRCGSGSATATGCSWRRRACPATTLTRALLRHP